MGHAVRQTAQHVCVCVCEAKHHMSNGTPPNKLRRGSGREKRAVQVKGNPASNCFRV